MLKRLCCVVVFLGLIGSDLFAQARMRGTLLRITTDTMLSSVPEDIALGANQVAIQGTSGRSPYTFAITSGSAPTGVSLGSDGIFTGTPTTATTYNFVVTITDALSVTATKAFTWTITATGGGLPAGWTCAQVGGVSGSCAESSGTWTIATTNGVTYGTSDSFSGAYYTANGANYAMARVTACSTSGGLGSEECVIRVSQTLNANSAQFTCGFGDVNTGVFCEWRNAAGGSTNSTIYSAGTETGWVQIVVYQGQSTGQYSSDGVTWADIPVSGAGSPVPPNLTGDYYFWLTTNGNNVGTATATMTNVSIDTFVPPDTEDSLGYRSHWFGVGWGADTNGGRGGGSRIGRITTTTISGSPSWAQCALGGDFFDCMATPSGCTESTQGVTGSGGNTTACARFVLVDVSGVSTGPTVTGTGDNIKVFVRAPYMTFAGQTAPQDNEGSCSANCSSVGGFVLSNVALHIETHDIVIQHLKMMRIDWRPCGTNGGSGGCSFFGGYMMSLGDPTAALPIGARHVYNVVIDHNSFIWNIGSTNTLVIAEGAEKNQVLDSFQAEPIYWDDDGNYSGSYCSGINSYTDRIVYARNAHITCWGRNPSMGLGQNWYDGQGNIYYESPSPQPWYQRIAFYNNVIVGMINNNNWGGGQIFGLPSWNFRPELSVGYAGVMQMALTDNAFIATAQTTTNTFGYSTGNPSAGISVAAFSGQVAGVVSLFMQGNTDNWGNISASSGNGQWTNFDVTSNKDIYELSVVTTGATSNIRCCDVNGNNSTSGTLPYQWWDDFAGHQKEGTYSQIRDFVVANAGAYPAFPDAETTRIKGDATDLGGDYSVQPSFAVMPTFQSASRTCSPPSSPNTVYDALSGRTRIEVWLEGIDDLDGTADCDARRVEVTQGVP